MSVYKNVRLRDRWCRVCGDPGEEVHHIVFRSQGGEDTEENLIFLCGGCHRRAHNTNPDYIAPWELQFMLLFDTRSRLVTERQLLRHLRYGRCCLSCEYRTETWECPVWDHPVDPDYSCDVWKERDMYQLPDCRGQRQRRRAAPLTLDQYSCIQCLRVVNLHVKDDG